MTKPSKTAVSLIIKDAQGRYLMVKRPDDPRDDIGGVWGFPAASGIGDESERETAHRVASGKLGVRIKLGRKIGESTHERRAVVLRLIDYEARIIEGSPHVPQPDAAITQYVDLQFSNDPRLVIEAARKGSQCTQLFLDDLGIEWRDESDGPSTSN